MYIRNPKFWRLFFVRFFPTALALCALFVALFLQNASHQEENLKNNERMSLGFTSKAVSVELGRIFQDLNDLTSRLSLIRYIEFPTVKGLRDVTQSFYYFSEVNPQYDQIRVLDQHGMELLRINRNSARPIVVPKEELQDKSDRYYFLDAVKLPPGEAYSSPFDLNVERGEVETPYKPMLRVAAPLRNAEGVIKGVLVMNYLGRSFFQILEREINSASRIMLLNEAGYWLYGGRDKDWAFMFPGREGDAFAASEQDVWQSIRASPSGQIMAHDGMFTYDKLEFSPDALRGVSRLNVRVPEAYRQRWTLVSLMPAGEIAKARWRGWPAYLGGFVCLLALAALGCALLVTRNLERMDAESAVKRGEERFRVLVESSPDIIWEIDTSGVFTYVSPRVEDILGYPPEALIGQPLSKIMSEKEVRASMARMDASEEPHSERPAPYVARCIHADGSDVELEARGAAILDADGAVTGRRGVSRDVTRERRNQRILERTRREADAANKAKSEFLARMSHEIRTPLNAIIGMTHLALRTDLTDKQLDYLSKIKSSSDSLLGIINDILDFSKIEAGRLTIESIPFNLDSVLASVIDVNSLHAEEKNLEFLVSIDKDVPFNLVGDPLRLGQMLVNLVSNAVKFTESGEVLLKADLEEENEDRVRIRFRVRDTGIGMDEDEIARLFQPFSQADGSITRRFGGTGLGLSICQRLATLMGGELTVMSHPEQGSEFSFALEFPLACELPASFSPADLKVVDGTPVLVVDDNASSRQILGESLSSLSFSPTLAVSGEEALRILERQPDHFKAVILDWKMPRMDGAQCAMRIKAMNLPNPPCIIIVTAYGQRDVRRKLESIGVDAFLLKPVSRSILYNALAECLGVSVVNKKAARTREANMPEVVFNGQRVLLVEDNLINQQVALELLEGFGLSVTVAASGEEALERLDKDTFEAVFMDLQMPGIGGLEAARRIRKRPELTNLPIIAMTAHAMRQDQIKTAAAGMNDHVNKPIDPDVLLEALKRWLPFEERAAGTAPAPAGSGAANAPPPYRLGQTNPDILDATMGLARVRGNGTLYAKLLGDFLSKYADVADTARDAFSRDSFGELREIIHAFKGVAGNLGFVALYATAEKAETSIKEGSEGLDDILDQLKTQCDNARAAAKEILGAAPAEEKKSEALYPSDRPADLSEEFGKTLKLLAARDANTLDAFEALSPALARIDAALTEDIANALRHLKFQQAQTSAQILAAKLAALKS